MNVKFFSKVRLLILISIIAVSVTFLVLVQEAETSNTVYMGPPKAVIIDQLYNDMPNEKFHQQAKEYLESAGYTVDIFTTNQVTVKFFENLPQMNYKFVVIRTHGVVDVTEDEPVVLFTGEKYQEDKYISEQLFGQVKRGVPFIERNFQLSEHDSSDWVNVNETYSYITTPANRIDTITDEYFLISPKFVDEKMVGKFHDTTFFLGGCNTLAGPSFAESLVRRGASAVVGWDDKVSSWRNDRSLLFALEQILIENMDIKDAVEAVKSSPNHSTPGHMAYPGIISVYTNENI